MASPLLVYSLALIKFEILLISSNPTKYQVPLQFPAATMAEEPLATPEQLHESFHQAVSVLTDLGVDYVPIKGTLIGLLHYGSTVRTLPEQRLDLVDIDFDFLVNVPFDQRISFSSKFFTRLEQLDSSWVRCSLDGPHPFYVERYRANRLMNLNCVRYEPYWLRIDIGFFEFFGEDELVTAKVCDPREHPPEGWVSAYDNVLQQNCSISPDTSWARVGRLPKSLIYPLKTCLGFGLDVSCPNRPIDFLYQTLPEAQQVLSSNGIRGQKTCLAFPYISSTRSCDLVHYFLLAQWTLEDDIAIRTRAQTLHSKGYESFASLLSSPQCRNPVHSIQICKRWFSFCQEHWPDFIRLQEGIQSQEVYSTYEDSFKNVWN